MTKVLVTQSKLDTLAEIVGGKSNTNVPLTLDEMITAADSITSGGGITPTGNINITSAGTTDVTNYATATVPSASFGEFLDYGFYTDGNNRKWRVRPKTVLDTSESGVEGWVGNGTYNGGYSIYSAIPTGTTVTPSTSSQTIGGTGYMMEGAVTVSAMPSGTAGTPTASKGAVSNHAISVTPSVTNAAGYITGGTKTGTAVSVSASELVSGTLSISQNGTADVTNYASVDVSVSGGGGSDVQIGQLDTTLSSASSSISFTNVGGEPTSFALWATEELTTGASPYKVAAVVYDGTNVMGQTITNTNNAQVSYDSSSFSYTYNNGTLTVSSTGAYFQPTTYFLTYSYDGPAGNIKTADVQVGSGATSITFTDVEDEPLYWSCIFKSNFSTSNGYQRVIGVFEDYDGIYGLEMDSSAKYSNSHWTSSYNNGSLTITSQGTNAGGYFHQPGYYQLTYAVSGDQSLQTKTVTPTTSTQNVTADTGYTALKKVVVNPIPSSYVQPTATQGATTYRASTSAQTIASGTYLTGTQTIAAVSQTNLTAGNIKSGTTISISNGQSNIWSVTGTYTGGGGGGSMNVQTNQSTSRTTSTSLTSVNSLTCSTSGTYDVYWTCTRSSTSGTWSSRLYIAGTASGSEQTTWSNHVQTVKLTGVTINADQTVAVYAKSRGSNYYAYAPQLTIVQTA